MNSCSKETESPCRESEQETQVSLIRASEAHLRTLEVQMHQIPVLITAERSKLYRLKCNLNKMMGK